MADSQTGIVRAFVTAAMALTFVAAGSVTRALGQQSFTSVRAFGDSYADTGNALAIAAQQFGVNSASYKFFVGRYPTGRLSGGTN